MSKISKNGESKVSKSKAGSQHLTHKSSKSKAGSQHLTQNTSSAKNMKIEEAIRITLKFHKDALKDLERF